MNPAELLALAQQLLYDCCDPVTGEPLYTGQSSYACVEDVEAAAHYLRDCAEAEPVATVPHGWKLVPIAPTPEMLATTSWPGCAATDYAHMLAAAPQPPSAQADALHGVASEHDIGYAAGWRNCADNAAVIVAAHIDRLEPGRQQRTQDALLDLLASMRSILVSQRAAKETSR